jgi:hypothetical protein
MHDFRLISGTRAARALTKTVSDESGMSLVIVLVLMTVLAVAGGVAIRKATVDVKTSGNYKETAQVLYIAESGAERARAGLAGLSINDLLAGPDGKTGTTADDADNGTFGFGTHVAFGGGWYKVTATDNDDHDGNVWHDSDGVVVIRSEGQLPDGSRRAVEVVLAKTGAPATGGFRAAIMSRGPIAINGTITVDGRDHDLAGSLLSPAAGVLAISSMSTFDRGGNGKVGGTSLMGINYALSKSTTDVTAVTEQNTTAWGNPATPEQVLGMAATDALKTIAQSGVNGSQYVTDPSAIHFPLSGVTYVEPPDGHVWDAIDFHESSGILIVHNATTNAVVKNTNGGTFAGIIIADDYIHIHDDILGVIVTLTTGPSEGNVIGNGSGTVNYSSQAVSNALSNLVSHEKILSWREL